MAAPRPLLVCPLTFRRPDISATTSETLATCSVAPWSAVNNPAESLREGLRLFFKFKIDA